MKWHWTPGGVLRVLIVIGLLAGAAFTEGVISTAMLVVGLLVLALSWIATFRHVWSKGNKTKRR